MHPQPHPRMQFLRYHLLAWWFCVRSILTSICTSAWLFPVSYCVTQYTVSHWVVTLLTKDYVGVYWLGAILDARIVFSVTAKPKKKSLVSFMGRVYGTLWHPVKAPRALGAALATKHNAGVCGARGAGSWALLLGFRA